MNERTLRATSLKSILILMLLGLSLNTFAKEKIAKVFFLKGDAYCLSDAKISKLKKDLFLYDGDTVKTKKDSVLILSYGANFLSKIKIDQNSKLKLIKEDFGANKKKANFTQLLLNKGVVIINSFNNKDIAEVKTKTASMGIRGTEFFVYINSEKSGEITTTVKSGKIDVAATKGKEKATLESGKSTMVTEFGDVSPPATYKWQADINWRTDPQRGILAQKKELFDEIDRQYKAWKEEMKEKRRKWKEDARKQQKKLKNQLKDQRKKIWGQ